MLFVYVIVMNNFLRVQITFIESKSNVWVFNCDFHVVSDYLEEKAKFLFNISWKLLTKGSKGNFFRIYNVVCFTVSFSVLCKFGEWEKLILFDDWVSLGKTILEH